MSGARGGGGGGVGQGHFLLCSLYSCTRAVNYIQREQSATKKQCTGFTLLYLLFCSSSCFTKVDSHSWHSNEVREEVRTNQSCNQDCCKVLLDCST